MKNDDDDADADAGGVDVFSHNVSEEWKKRFLKMTLFDTILWRNFVVILYSF
jgi:hypothetical protein